MLVEELNMSKNTIWRILTEDLGKRKVCARFVSHQLSTTSQDQKSQRIFDEKGNFSHQPPSVFALSITM